MPGFHHTEHVAEEVDEAARGCLDFACVREPSAERERRWRVNPFRMWDCAGGMRRGAEENIRDEGNGLHWMAIMSDWKDGCATIGFLHTLRSWAEETEWFDQMHEITVRTEKMQATYGQHALVWSGDWSIDLCAHGEPETTMLYEFASRFHLGRMESARGTTLRWRRAAVNYIDKVCDTICSSAGALSTAMAPKRHPATTRSCT